VKPSPLRLLIALAWACLAGCSSVTVNTDFALDQDFSQFHRYAWHPDGVKKSASLDALGGDIFDNRVRRAVEDILASKGMSRGEPADFYINYSVVTEDRMSVQTYDTYAGYGPGWGYPRWGYGPYYYPYGGGTQTSVYYYKQGTLIIDVVDAKTNKLAWRSTAEGPVDLEGTPEQREQGLRKAIGKMFERFPPEPASKGN
jgi:hypothetical protein